ncbi:MAG: UDP-N-acetylmuramate dehydrogenase [Cytophagaceae bacterium]|nr:UDP-N-acetylmuramate dehydrogenase [Cytophagaceae bacterium]MDW8456007.1 UDP-N-acetylmuramate dehydrogenase [Cytophagaceae bacterium]
MKIKENISLKTYNTFGVEATASYFSEFNCVEDLAYLYSLYPNYPKLILGEGSNILFTKPYEGLVLHNCIKGIKLEEESADEVIVSAASGERWHDLVMYCVEHGWAGIENLSLIPGTVGAAPVQNIGAYGVELKDVFHSLEAYDVQKGILIQMNVSDCAFGYRTSIFKTTGKDKFVIVKVSLRLKKNFEPNISYGAIRDTLAQMQVGPSIKSVSMAVIKIRNSKLPDPAKIGNAGSFFKNPEISAHHFENIKQEFKDVVSYPAPEGRIKIPAAWLIEKCGWKGKRIGDAGVHQHQALVLVNYGSAKGMDILELAHQIKESVQNKFGITLEEEVNVL